MFTEQELAILEEAARDLVELFSVTIAPILNEITSMTGWTLLG